MNALIKLTAFASLTLATPAAVETAATPADDRLCHAAAARQLDIKPGAAIARNLAVVQPSFDGRVVYQGEIETRNGAVHAFACRIAGRNAEITALRRIS